MIPLRSALRSSTRSTCRRCRPIAQLSLSTSTSVSRPISHYLPPVVGRSGGRSLHTSSVLGKEKKWVNQAEEEGEDKLKEKEDKEDKVESKVGESSKSASERQKDTSTILAESESSSSSSGSGNSAAGAAGSAGSSSSSSPSSSDPPSPSKTGKEIAKPSIPEVYPQVLALPITRRPLFPGFYKAVTITSPSVIKAIRELIAHGQPYIGAFLLKDSNSDSDVITSMDQVHPVGVFAQITSVFGSTEVPAKEGEPSGEGKPETLTAVLYPHRRIRIDELITSAPPPTVESVPVADVIEEVTKDETRDESEGEVASFEKEVPTVDDVKEGEQKSGFCFSRCWPGG